MSDDLPIEDELTTTVMLTEIQQMSVGSLTITINEYRDIKQSIGDAVTYLLNDDLIDTEQVDRYIETETIVQITSNGITDEETIDIFGPSLEEAIGAMYYYLKDS